MVFEKLKDKKKDSWCTLTSSVTHCFILANNYKRGCYKIASWDHAFSPVYTKPLYNSGWNLDYNLSAFV